MATLDKYKIPLIIIGALLIVISPYASWILEEKVKMGAGQAFFASLGLLIAGIVIIVLTLRKQPLS